MDLVTMTKTLVEGSGRMVRLVGAVVPQAPMWAVLDDGKGGVTGEPIHWLNLYAVFTAGDEDFTIAVPVVSALDGMGLEEVDDLDEDFIGISVGKAPRAEDWLQRAEYHASLHRRAQSRKNSAHSRK